MILKQGFKPSQIILGIPTYAYRLELSSPELVPRTVNGQTSYFYQNHTAATPVSSMVEIYQSSHAHTR
jgi:hypothetical protein